MKKVYLFIIIVSIIGIVLSIVFIYGKKEPICNEVNGKTYCTGYIDYGIFSDAKLFIDSLTGKERVLRYF